MLREVRFRFTHANCWLQETTERHPTVTLVVSTVYQVEGDIHVDLAVHAPEAGLLDLLLSEWGRDPRIKRIVKLHEGPKGARFHVSYTSEHSVYPSIIQSTPVLLGTITMGGGVEHYRFLGEAEHVEKLLQVLKKDGDVQVEAIRTLSEVDETEAAKGPRLLPTLTDKQVTALLLAHAAGYYNWPRKLSASDLARHVGLSSAAFLDHLRRAEARAVDAVVAELRQADPARAEAIQARLRQPAAKGPRETPA